jgi:hypothetical protein
LGWNVSGRSDTEHALEPLKEMLARIGGSGITQDLHFDTDSGSFLIAGVPALHWDVVEDQYDSIVHHKAADTLDKVDDHDLTTGAAMLAVTAHAFADAEVRPAPRLSWPAERQPEARDLRLRLGAGAQLRWVSLMVVTGLTRSAVALR